MSDFQQQDDLKIGDRFWFKIYNEIHSDIRFTSMSAEHLGIYVSLLALANNAHNLGRVTADRQSVAHALRISPAKLEKALADYEQKRLVYVVGDVIEITDERHYTGAGLNPSDFREAKNERMRQHRNKVKAEEEARRAEVTGDSHVSPARSELSESESHQRGVQNRKAVELGVFLQEEGFEEDEPQDSIDPHDEKVELL